MGSQPIQHRCLGRRSLTVCFLFQFQLTYDLFIAAFAGAGITLLALVSKDQTTRITFPGTTVTWHVTSLM